jgi:hypothetical protein
LAGKPTEFDKYKYVLSLAGSWLFAGGTPGEALRAAEKKRPELAYIAAGGEIATQSCGTEKKTRITDSLRRGSVCTALPILLSYSAYSVAHICMDKILKFNGIPFHIKYEGGILTTCNPLCPNCQSALVKQVAEDGRAAHVCNAQGEGCENPLESFSCAEEMAEFERAVAIEIERSTKVPPIPS